MKTKLLTFLLAFWASIGVAFADDSGTCGDNLAYSYDSSTGTLTITGTGAMTNWSLSTSVPWYSYRSAIKTVNLPEGLTSIGEDAFRGCGVTNIIIPNSVTSIGWGAFYSCTFMNSVIIGNNVEYIGESAFKDCSGLTSVTIPNSVTGIGGFAFDQCTELKSIYNQCETPPSISKNQNICNYLIPIYVPLSSFGKYKSSDRWSRYNIQISLIKDEVLSPTSVAITLSDMFEPSNDDVDIVSVGVDGGEMIEGNTMEYIGLEPESEYADVPIAILLSSGDVVKTSVSFTTTALTLNTLPSKAVSSNTAILLAETNISDSEVSCGFEWKRNDAPDDMAGTMVYCPVANGMMAGRLKGLKDDVYYKYRAFYKSSAGNMHYGSWQYIFTGDNAVEFDPVLYTYAASSVSESGATLRGYALAGSDDFTEQGFEYWVDSRVDNLQEAASAQMRAPVANAEHHRVQATGIAMKVGITGLDEGTVYKYRTYAKIGQQTVYGAEMTFTTKGVWIEPTALEGVDADEASLKPRKVIENGRIVIIMPDGRKYDVTGRALSK